MTKPLDTASGDLLADRRADYAEMLFANGDHAAAAELLLGALELAPDWALGWFRLGEFHEAAGNLAAAAAAWKTVRRLDPKDRAGAALKLSLIGALTAPDAPPSAFVEALFDQHAEKFDRSLVEELGYRAPQLLADAIRMAAPGHRFTYAVDLGCGTGLMGAELRPLVDHLEGHDLSSAMLAKARAKGFYDALVQSDLQTLRLPSECADLVTAADVFMYVGALDVLLGRLARAVVPGGLLAFSVEALEGESFALRDTRRFAHSARYVEKVLADCGLLQLSFDRAVLRRDRNADVVGSIVIAQRPAARGDDHARTPVTIRKFEKK